MTTKTILNLINGERFTLSEVSFIFNIPLEELRNFLRKSISQAKYSELIAQSLTNACVKYTTA